MNENLVTPTPTITAVRFQTDTSPLSGQVTVWARLSNHGDQDPDVRVFLFYPDELAFSARELVGKTLDEARALKRDRDIAYLQS